MTAMVHSLRLRLVAAVLLLAGCGDAERPRWQHLAAGFEPSGWSTGALAWPGAEGAGDLTLEPAAGEHGLWVQRILGRDAWRPSGMEGIWDATAGLPALGRPADGSAPCSLSAQGWSLSFVEGPALGAAFDPRGLAVGDFTLVGDRVFLVTGADREPPAEARMRSYLARGSTVDGRWRVPLRGLTAEGLPLVTGTSETLTLEVPRGSALGFGTSGAGGSGPNAPLTFRIALDGESIFEHTQSVSPGTPCAWHRVPLPAGGARRLTFEVTGPPALGAFLVPVLGPAEVGRPDARPWGADRANLVLFLADTFRADNLGTYGGTRELSPHLDAFAQESLVFERAWSPSSWTLPAQASMLTGLFPHQHAATSGSQRLPQGLVTLAERLREAGYRTVAVTDGAYVSAAYGMDQGFEWFVELPAPFDGPGGTLETVRELLAADDGRPLFLFLQTYKTHVPYRVSEATRRDHGQRLGLSGEFEAVAAALDEAKTGWTQGQPVRPEMLAAVRPYRALYEGTVLDLDRGFATLRDDLEAGGYAGDTYLLFTSDHGEAFFEHDHLGHGVGVWEEFIRIPLILHGPGLAPGRRSAAATLVDLPRTLAFLADVAPDPGWLGQPLTELTEDRPVFSFECRMTQAEASTLALIRDHHKVLVPASTEALTRGEVQAAYDLASDPAERADAWADQADWARRLLEDLAAPAGHLFSPRTASESADLDPEKVMELRAIGY